MLEQADWKLIEDMQALRSVTSETTRPIIYEIRIYIHWIRLRTTTKSFYFKEMVIFQYYLTSFL